MAENAPSELRDLLEEEEMLGSGCPVSFEGEAVTGRAPIG
jgi:hypothetical protein